MKNYNLPAYDCSFLLSSDFWNLPLRLVSLVVFQIRLGNGQESFPIPHTVKIHQQGYTCLPSPTARRIVLSGQSSAGEPGRGCWWADQISATRSSTSQLTIITILPWLEIEIWYYGILWYCGRTYLWIRTYINTCMSHENNISLAGIKSLSLNPIKSL